MNIDDMTILGANKIYKGVKSETLQTQVQDPITGQIYNLPQIVGQEIYSCKNRKYTSKFMICLETGKRGWYPGCRVIAKINGDLELKRSDNENSETLLTLPNLADVQILTIIGATRKPKWLKIKYLDSVGYIKSSNIYDIRYID